MATDERSWERYRPEAGDPWDLRKVAHLHRRAGFGATWAELQRDLRSGPEAAVDRLLNPPQWPADERAVAAALAEGAVAAGNIAAGDIERLQAWWLYRMLYGPDPLGEKLALFWHSHFASGIRKVYSVAWMLRQNETLRRGAPGKLSDLLNAIVADPAMLRWLDGVENRRQHPNENFAREFLELFTLGLGSFAESDVREAARAFTGWMGGMKEDAHRDPVIEFDESRFDPGTKTFLGQTGPWKSADIVRIALGRPGCAWRLARKLYRFFVSETAEPSDELIEPLARDWQAHDYSIRRVVERILRSRHFFSPEAYRRRIKSPVEFSQGMVRALEIPRAEVNLLRLAAACKAQGQELFEPPSVKGWDGGKSWLNTTTLLERTNLASDLAWGNTAFGVVPATLSWVERDRASPDEAAEKLFKLLLDGNVPDKAKAILLADRPAADQKGGPKGRPAAADYLRSVLQRILSCPEYQLA